MEFVMIGNISSPATTLDQTTSTLNRSLNRLGTGARINSAKDDPSGLAIAAQMAAQLGSTNQASRNISDGLSVTSTADGALSQVSDTLQRMREIAVQSANGTLNAGDRQALQAEFSQLGQSVDQIADQAQFNGQKLLDGSFSAEIQSGPAVGDTQTVSLASVSSQALGIAGIDVSTAQGSTSALDAIDKAISAISDNRTTIGAAQAGLSSASAALSGTYENLASARSRIFDTDYASESENLSRSSVSQQAGLKALSLYNANQASVLGLLKGKIGA